MDMVDQVKESQPFTWNSREMCFLTERWWLNSAIMIRWQISEVSLEEPAGHPHGWQGDEEENLDGV